MSRPDPSTTTSPLKRNRYFVLWTEVARIQRIRHPVPPTPIESDDPLGTQPSSALHDCPVITDPVLKHAEDNIPLSESDVPSTDVFSTSSSQMEIPLLYVVLSVGLIVTEVSQPLSRDSVTSSLSTAEVFRHKLFGVGLGRFQASIVEATIVIMNPLNLESDTPRSSLMLINTFPAEPSTESNPPLSSIDHKLISLFFMYKYLLVIQLIKSCSFFLLCLFIVVIPYSSKEASIPTLTRTSLLENESHLTSAAAIRASELRWLVQEIIPSFVHALLNSADFADLNVAVQTTAIQLGLHQTCMEMKEKYVNALERKNVIYLYPNVQHQVLDQFSSMITHMYYLFGILEGVVVDLGILKEKLGVLDPTSNPNGASGSV
ncbi:unnamed protein product [Lactuca saligna]|uniref:Uncharacterized protein n=1 Tax=Lactuca saligna TaxID=75948 RepID=A0AA36DVZ3_LACSI|nr:unnamed protein product [Lactuca saligna]